MLAALVALSSLGCGSTGITSNPFQTSDRERYTGSLQGVDLHRSTMGRAWIAAGDDALRGAETMRLPWREELFFTPDAPAALAWALDLERGQKLRATLIRSDSSAPAVNAPGESAPRFFLELFRRGAEGEANPALVAEVDATGALVHDIDEDGAFLLRLQPELLAGGRLTLEVTGGGQLTFPVAGKDARAIGSGFGDPRDGGRRRHKGVDIFAPRGTAAVAAVDGFVTRVGTNRLGGRVVWMRGGGKSFYYAHLDEQLAGVGPISAGEPLGKVGNTGNARSTPPHLHFGLFDGGGALDPAPYLAAPGTPPAVTADLEPLGGFARVTGAKVRLRAGPSTKYEIRDELPRHTVLRLESAAGSWYRVRLGDGRRGYMAGSLLAPAERPIRSARVEQDAYLRHQPRPNAPEIHRLDAGESVGVLGEAEDYLLVRTATDVVGWLARTLES